MPVELAVLVFLFGLILFGALAVDGFRNLFGAANEEIDPLAGQEKPYEPNEETRADDDEK